MLDKLSVVAYREDREWVGRSLEDDMVCRACTLDELDDSIQLMLASYLESSECSPEPASFEYWDMYSKGSPAQSSPLVWLFKRKPKNLPEIDLRVYFG